MIQQEAGHMGSADPKREGRARFTSQETGGWVAIERS